MLLILELRLVRAPITAAACPRFLVWKFNLEDVNLQGFKIIHDLGVLWMHSFEWTGQNTKNRA